MELYILESIYYVNFLASICPFYVIGDSSVNYVKQLVELTNLQGYRLG